MYVDNMISISLPGNCIFCLNVLAVRILMLCCYVSYFLLMFKIGIRQLISWCCCISLHSNTISNLIIIINSLYVYYYDINSITIVSNFSLNCPQRRKHNYLKMFFINKLIYQTSGLNGFPLTMYQKVVLKELLHFIMRP